MESYLKAGVYGVILTCALNLFVYGLDVIPPFIITFGSVIMFITIFRIEKIQEALVISLMTYFFSDVILGVFAYSLLYFDYFMESIQVTIQFSVLNMINLCLTPITAVSAAILGIHFVKIRGETYYGNK